MATTKVYVGERGANGSASVFIEETVDGRSGRRALRHIKRHSPTGFEWGYAGSGPADLANAILADVVSVREGVSPRMYQKFKFDVVCMLDRTGFRLTYEAVQDWINKRWSAMAEAEIKVDLVAG